MNLSDEIRKQIEKNKGLKLAVGEINNHLSILENLVRKDIMEQVDEAYQKGLEDGKQTAVGAAELREKLEYQRGLSEGNDIGYKDGVNDGRNEAWEAARKIAQQWEEDTDTEHRLVIDDSISVTLDSMTASEAIEKLKAYEEEQKADDKIEVGDELEHTVSGYTSKAIFLEKIGNDEDEDWYKCLFWTGCGVAILSYPKSQFKRTGRHFDIEKLLEAMKA